MVTDPLGDVTFLPSEYLPAASLTPVGPLILCLIVISTVFSPTSLDISVGSHASLVSVSGLLPINLPWDVLARRLDGFAPSGVELSLVLLRLDVIY